MITINTNTTAMVAQNNLNNTQSNYNSSMLKLSTGLRINSASDDAAGMQISNRMETQINGLDVAQRNANDAISMAQTAEGAMVEVSDMLNRMRDLSLQSANDTNTDADRKAMQKEITALQKEITRVNETTNFAGIDLLDGHTGTNAFTFQVGSNANETIDVEIGEISLTSLKGDITTASAAAAVDVTGVTDILANGAEVSIGTETIDIAAATDVESLVSALNAEESSTGVHFAVDQNGTGLVATSDTDVTATIKDSGGTALTGTPSIALTGAGSVRTENVGSIDIKTATGAQEAVEILDGALAYVDDQRANLGAVQNRLESTIDNLSNISTNMTASQSRIKDVDFAKETTNMTNQQMMMQAGSTILAQAKQMPQYAAQLLG